MTKRQAVKTAEPAERAPGEPEEALLTTEQAAELIMKSGERVRQLAKAGWIKRQGTSTAPRYVLRDVVQGYLRFREDEERRTTKTAAASRVSDARAREIELRNAVREGKLIELDEATANMVELVGMVRANLSGLPARCTRDLQMRRTIETAVNDILEKLADLALERSKGMGADREGMAAIETNGAGRVGG